MFLRFCLVGASGYAVNLAVYSALLSSGVHYQVAATGAFLVAASSNYVWNRVWTFGARQARILGQSARALAVSALSLGAKSSGVSRHSMSEKSPGAGIGSGALDLKASMLRGI